MSNKLFLPPYHGGMFGRGKEVSTILLASIGNGTYDKGTKEKNYFEANYELEQEKFCSAYIYDVLLKFKKVDKIIFIGTAGSNWFMFYEHLFEENSVNEPEMEKDENYSESLLDLYLKKDKYKTLPTDVKNNLAQLKETFGEKCLDIVVLRYGLNNKEIFENFQILSSLSEYISDGDTIYFDMTHAFRSLAFYELLAVNYIKDTLGKKIKIDYVSYGMFEFRFENSGVTPIVDQSALIKMLDWTKAMEEYNKFGTGFLLAEFLKNNATGQYLSQTEVENSLGIEVTDKELEALQKLASSNILVNNFLAFKNLVITCNTIVENAVRTETKNPVFYYIFEDLSRRFGKFLNDDVLLSIELAKWHLEKNRFVQAATVLVGAILNYCSKITGLKISGRRDEPNSVNNLLPGICSQNKHIQDFRDLYIKIRDLRNELAHPEDFESNRTVDSTRGSLGNYIGHFKKLYVDFFQNNEDNINELIRAFGITPQ